MFVRTELHRFQNGIIRVVRVPESAIEDAVLESEDDKVAILPLVFEYGQNEVQPKEGRCSLSSGDVIYVDDQPWLVMPVGFRQLSRVEYDFLRFAPERAKGTVLELLMTKGAVA